jgi:ADP-ribose pyrophosphatase YjhB (NUDIX family)
MNFCSHCGKTVHRLVPPGDHRSRYVCDACGTVHYENPRMIVGCLPRWEDKVLLCKRTNEPRSGKWTLPAGFLENDEAVEVGAERETMEEANADVKIVRLLSIYSVPVVAQVYLFFLADLQNLNFSPGMETERTELFRRNEIPWNEVAFSSVEFTLQHYFANPDSSQIHLGAYTTNRD